MKLKFKQTTILLLLLLGLIGSCKHDEVTVKTPNELLCSSNSKTWQIEKLYLNDTLFQLTPEQMKYTRTYKTDSSYYDSDGISGKYNLANNGNQLVEKMMDGGIGTLTYKVETLNKTQLVIRLIDDGSSNPNTLFQFHAN